METPKQKELRERREASPYGLDDRYRPYKTDRLKVLTARKLRIAERKAWKEGRFKYLNPALR